MLSYFDLSGERGNIGTVNTALPDTSLHYVPFTYAGTVNAYSLNSSTDASGAATASARSLFVGDYNIGAKISWNSLNTANLIFGKTFATHYKLRSLSAGNSSADSKGSPATNEWDQILDKSGSADNTTGWIKNWGSNESLAQDKSEHNESGRAARGGSSARYWSDSNPTLSPPSTYGSRPALEVLNTAALTADGLQAVTLNLGGGKLNGNTANINIICAGNFFTVPSGEGLTAPDGATFAGWKGSDGTTFAAGTLVLSIVTGLTAQWATSGPTALTGTATISNTTPRIGDTLTASLEGGNNSGTLSYVWKAGGDPVGTGASYQVLPANLDKAITLEITSSVETGTVSSAPTTAVAKKAAPAAPGAPTLLLKTNKYVMLTANSNYDFSKDGINWQADNTFTDLSANTKYTFYQRFSEKLDTEPSAASAGFEVTTDAVTYTITANPTTKNFGSLSVGYSAPAAQTVIITNTGNSSLTLTQPTSTNYTIGTLSDTTLVENGTATFTVAPKTGLAVGNHNETLTVSTDHSTSATVELSFTVTAAPAITGHPSPQTVNAGQSASFSVTATGTGLTYQWQANTGSGFMNISNGGVYSGAATATLTITGATAGMNGYQYRAVVSGSAAPAVTSNSATLTVNAAPNYTITANPTSKNFGSLATGYSAPAAQSVTITNTGNSSVTLTQPTSTNYTIGALSTTTLAANGTATFTVTPKAGLAVGNHNETLTVSTNHNTNATVELSFTVTAAPTYTVIFNPNGGTVGETMRSVAPSTAVGALPTPTRSGSYSFDGWYTAASGGTQISASTTVNANVSYYAHWTYTGGGSSSGNSSLESSTSYSTGVVATGNLYSSIDVLVLTPRSTGTTNEVVDSATYSQLRQAVDSGYFPVAAFDVRASSYSGRLTLSFPVGAQYNGMAFEVKHKTNDGTIHTYTGTVENGKAVVTVNSLSPFMVAIKGANKNPNTGR